MDNLMMKKAGKKSGNYVATENGCILFNKKIGAQAAKRSVFWNPEPFLWPTVSNHSLKREIYKGERLDLFLLFFRPKAQAMFQL